ncbi:MAG: DNA topoisomerase IV subunit A [Alphaproteobacteria bacterium]|jgi:topoisomerase IV subunit A|nr:DNA topoisomerase IV subunit A [Alphaproteobacteria bacterium]
MNDLTPDQPDSGDIRPEPFSRALSERYLAYALSTITSRSLPDARDGLKPVHRRLVFAMRELGLNPAAAFKKCARVVGDVMGKYHPHGDGAIYDAMARLAQDFAVRYPLVDGQGNFGNIDGDNPAAMRYTEARLTAVAEALLDGIQEDAVDFRETYDGEGREPTVLPSAFPNLLANGAQGIAVGMATNIPPHNVDELCEALLLLIKKRSTTTDELLELVPGPDFPTGGLLCEAPETIAEAYRTGRGSFRLRARWEKEELPRGQWQIIVTEIPYQVSKSRLIEKTATLLEEKKLFLLGDIQDESAEDVRIVLTPRARTVDPKTMMEQLFKLTDLESRVGINMNALDGEGSPRVMSLKDLLRIFLDHRQEVLLRRSRFRLAAIAHRLEILAGYMIVYLNLDEVIRIVREEDNPRASLMATFELNETQADAILNMRLRSLRRLEELEIKKEIGGLEAEQAELTDLVGDEAKQWRRVGAEVREMRKVFGKDTALGRRRTGIQGPPADVEVPRAADVEREPITVVCSKEGWLRGMKGHLAPDAEIKYREGDEERFRFHAQTTDRLLALASDGRVYTLEGDKLPGGRGAGEPIRLAADIAADAEIVALMIAPAEGKMLMATSDGRGFLAPAAGLSAQTRAGRQVLNVTAPAKAAIMYPVPADADSIAVVGENRRLLIFSTDDLPEMGRGKGVILQRYKGGGLADAIAFKLEDGLKWSAAGDRTRHETDLAAWQGKRASAGTPPPFGFPKPPKFGVDSDV